MALLFVIAVLLAHVSTAITTTSTNLPRVYLVPHSHDDVGWVDDMDIRSDVRETEREVIIRFRHYSLCHPK